MLWFIEFCFARHFANGSYKIKRIDFDQSYSPVAHSDSFRINITIKAMHKLTSRILDVSNAFQNKNIPIHERVCVIPPPYCIYWFERSYPNVTFNLDDGPFFLQCTNKKNESIRAGILFTAQYRMGIHNQI